MGKKLEVYSELLDQDDLYELIKKYAEINEEQVRLKSDSDKIKSDLRIIGKDEYLAEYEISGNNPNSIIIKALSSEGNIAEFLFVPNDKYLSITDKEEYENILNIYGDESIDKISISTLNPIILKKYQNQIVNLLKNADFLEEHEHEDILKKSETYSIKKGTINRLNEYESITEAYRDLRVIDSIKSAKVFK